MQYVTLGHLASASDWNRLWAAKLDGGEKIQLIKSPFQGLTEFYFTREKVPLPLIGSNCCECR